MSASFAGTVREGAPPAVQDPPLPRIPRPPRSGGAELSHDALGSLRQFVQAWSAHATSVTDAIDEQGLGQASTVSYNVCDALTDPLAVVCDPQESLSVGSLVATDNPAFSKLVTVFAYLICEVGRLRADGAACFLPLLTVFGERSGGGERGQAELEAALAEALPALQNLLGFEAQLRRVAANLYGQLCALYADKQRLYAPLKLVRLSAAFASLGDALSLLHSLDECVRANGGLPTAFALLKRQLERLEADPQMSAAAGCDAAAAAALDAALGAMEARLLPASLFDETLNALCGPEGGPPPKRLQDELCAHTVGALEAALGRVAGGAERPGDRAELLSCLCLGALHCRLAPLAPDRRLCAAMWAVFRACHALPVSDQLLCQPLAFFRAHLPPAALATGPKDPSAEARRRCLAPRQALRRAAPGAPRGAKQNRRRGRRRRMRARRRWTRWMALPA